jgi:hypothetical protein
MAGSALGGWLKRSSKWRQWWGWLGLQLNGRQGRSAQCSLVCLGEEKEGGGGLNGGMGGRCLSTHTPASDGGDTPASHVSGERAEE